MKQLLLFVVVTALVVAGLDLRTESAELPKTGEKGLKPMLKALIHINFTDSERQKSGLKNISNILKETAGAAEIEVVCHGGGIGLLVKDTSDHAEEVTRLVKEGVRFVACENTLKDKAIPKESLLPGVTTVASGAVEVIIKQHQGFGYFKP